MKTPILLIVFNRPDLTKQVFSQIRKVRPAKLYVACDGERLGKNDEPNVKKVKDIVDQVDWPCQVKKNYADSNLGCRVAVKKAVDWFFENEEMGIILEDDVVTAPFFFTLCNELLDKYRNDQRVMMISGLNNSRVEIEEASYFFSRYSFIWGWATWRRAWQKCEKKLDRHTFEDVLKNIFTTKIERVYWRKNFSSEIYWDYLWQFSIWKENGLVCIPKKNLIKNIGFGQGATNTEYGDGTLENLKISYDTEEISHPSTMVPSLEFEKEISYHHYYIRWYVLALKKMASSLGVSRPFIALASKILVFKKKMFNR